MSKLVFTWLGLAAVAWQCSRLPEYGTGSCSLVAQLAFPCLCWQSIIGMKLGSFINVFEDWTARFGEDTSLLSGLWMRALEGTDDAWRVGVHVPGALGSSKEANQVRCRHTQASVCSCCMSCKAACAMRLRFHCCNHLKRASHSQ